MQSIINLIVSVCIFLLAEHFRTQQLSVRNYTILHVGSIVLLALSAAFADGLIAFLCWVLFLIFGVIHMNDYKQESERSMGPGITLNRT